VAGTTPFRQPLPLDIFQTIEAVCSTRLFPVRRTGHAQHPLSIPRPVSGAHERTLARDDLSSPPVSGKTAKKTHPGYIMGYQIRRTLIHCPSG
jgi:hypothetical protein